MAWLWRTIAAAVSGLALTASAIAQQEALTSASCFDPALYEQGAVQEFDIRFVGSSQKADRLRREVIGREIFNGRTAIKINQIQTTGETSFVSDSYFDIDDKNIMFLGAVSENFKILRNPDEKYPIALAKDTVLRQEFIDEFRTSNGDTTAYERRWATTFAGIETIKLDIGNMLACKFVIKVRSRKIGKSTYKTWTDVLWFASGKPYQGLLLRSRAGQYDNLTSEVTRVRMFTVK